MLTDQSRADAVSAGQEPSPSAKFVDETGIKGQVEARIKWQQGNQASLLAALRKLGLVPVVKRRLIWAIVVEPKASTSASPSSLLGVSESQLVDVHGEPSDRGESSPRGEREFFYDEPDKQFSFLVTAGTVRGVGIRNGTNVPLSETICIGVPMQRVTDLCGGYTSEEELAGDTPNNGLEQGVLYKKTLPGGQVRYFLRYPELRLCFTFMPDRTLQSVWIGDVQ